MAYKCLVKGVAIWHDLPMKPFLSAAIFLLTMGAQCQDPDHPKPPPPSDSTWCGPAEVRMKELRRKNGEPCRELVNPDGKSFTQVCEEIHANGQNLHPQCIATDPRVKTCEDISPVCQWGQTP